MRLRRFISVTSCPSGRDLRNEKIGVSGKEQEMYCTYIHVENGVWVTVEVAGQSDWNKSLRKFEV
jgi:hypothetical protein